MSSDPKGPTPLSADLERAISARLLERPPTDPGEFPEFVAHVRAQLGYKDATIDAQATEIAALRGALERLLPLTEEFEYTLYGNFMGGDPREFSPDEEVCLPEEIAAWKSACEEWNRGEGVDRGPGCQTMGDGSAVTGTGFGLGTTIRKCAEREEAKRVLAGKEAQG